MGINRRGFLAGVPAILACVLTTRAGVAHANHSMRQEPSLEEWLATTGPRLSSYA